MDLFVLCVACLTVFVNCLVKQFVMCLGVVAILLLNVMEVFSVGEVLCWIDHVWYSKECVCCACDPSVHLSVPSIRFVFVSESWITGVCSPYVVVRFCILCGRVRACSCYASGPLVCCACLPSV